MAYPTLESVMSLQANVRALEEMLRRHLKWWDDKEYDRIVEFMLTSSKEQLEIMMKSHLTKEEK